jgi:hypothetical protein
MSLFLVVQIFFEKTRQHELLIINSLVKKFHQHYKESHCTDPVAQKHLGRHCKVKVTCVAGVSEEGVNSMGNQLVVRVFAIPD